MGLLQICRMAFLSLFYFLAVCYIDSSNKPGLVAEE